MERNERADGLSLAGHRVAGETGFKRVGCSLRLSPKPDVGLS